MAQIHERAATLFGKAKGDGPGDLSALSQVMVTGVEVSQTAGVSVVDLLVKAEMAASRRYYFSAFNLFLEKITNLLIVQ